MSGDFEIEVVAGDLGGEQVDSARSSGLIGWDIETSGLDWKTERVATCQVFVPGRGVAVVRMAETTPHRLISLLSDPSIRKVFHHAMFDLRFLAKAWSVQPRNVACTKVASKILRPSTKEHSLKDLVSRYLGITLEKTEQRSDWFASELSQSQLKYAAGDAVHLPELYQRMCEALDGVGLLAVAQRAFDFIPTQVQLDLLGVVGVFEY